MTHLKGPLPSSLSYLVTGAEFGRKSMYDFIWSGHKSLKVSWRVSWTIWWKQVLLSPEELLQEYLTTTRKCLQREVVVCVHTCALDAAHPWSKLRHGHSSSCWREAEGVDPARLLSGWEKWGTGQPHGAAQIGAALWSCCHHRDGHHPHPAGHSCLHEELCRWAAKQHGSQAKAIKKFNIS